MFWRPLVSAKNSPMLIRPAAAAPAASSPLARAIAVARSATSWSGGGEACAFNVYHLMQVDSPTALFPIKVEEI